MSESGDIEGQEATLQDRGGQGETAGVCSWKRMTAARMLTLLPCPGCTSSPDGHFSV